jgi:hypothetical protein
MDVPRLPGLLVGQKALRFMINNNNLENPEMTGKIFYRLLGFVYGGISSRRSSRHAGYTDDTVVTTPRTCPA